MAEGTFTPLRSVNNNANVAEMTLVVGGEALNLPKASCKLNWLPVLIGAQQQRHQ